MAGIKSTITTTSIDLLFECKDEAQADSFISTIQTSLNASGSGEFTGVNTSKSLASDLVNRMLTVSIPQKYLFNPNDTRVLNLVLLGIARDQIVPAVTASKGTTVKGDNNPPPPPPAG